MANLEHSGLLQIPTQDTSLNLMQKRAKLQEEEKIQDQLKIKTHKEFTEPAKFRATWKWRIRLSPSFGNYHVIAFLFLVLSLTNSVILITSIVALSFFRYPNFSHCDQMKRYDELEEKLRYLEERFSFDDQRNNLSSMEKLLQLLDQQQPAPDFPDQEEPKMKNDTLSEQVERKRRSSPRDRKEKRQNDQPAAALHLVNLRDRFVSTSNGLISYWVPDGVNLDNPSHVLTRHSQFDMNPMASSLHIKQSGLYLIYAQLFFESLPEVFNQFEIRIRSPQMNPRTVATCSTVAPKGKGHFDLSCFTSVAVSIKPGVRIFIQTKELGRQINMEPDKSFFGVIRLAN